MRFTHNSAFSVRAVPIGQRLRCTPPKRYRRVIIFPISFDGRRQTGADSPFARGVLVALFCYAVRAIKIASIVGISRQNGHNRPGQSRRFHLGSPDGRRGNLLNGRNFIFHITFFFFSFSDPPTQG